MDRRFFLKTAALLPLSCYADNLKIIQPSSQIIKPKQLYGVCVEINSRINFINEIQNFENYVEFKHDIVQYFSSFDYRMKPDMAKSSFYTIPFKIWEMGKIPFLSWYPGTGVVEPTPDDICKRIYSGKFDDYLKRSCNYLAKFFHDSKFNDNLGEPKLYLRFAHEMNYKNHAYSNNTKDFVKMWKYVYSFVRNFNNDYRIDLSKNRIQFVFCPGNFLIEKYPFELYYPGDEYLEWKGLDGYNWGGRSWLQFDEVFVPYLIRMNKLSSLPLSICEFGSSAKVYVNNKLQYNPELKKEWIKYAYEWLSNENNLLKYKIKMSIYYNLSLNKDIDSGIYVSDNSSLNNNTLNYVINGYRTIKNLNDVYIKKQSVPAGINRRTYYKIGFVNNNVNISQKIFQGDF
ncbi:hypothetical protein GCL60_15915 [Silvanigrella paludirubra]|uniref:GH26 domain-containing protein n=1 Tax=Silvanigrella paludirubra TaxID=2499159 RepID=A0A6N6VNB3_9BACT|nr:hypothetical protein [Silvanigrella paludirubra]KAB8036269.1 hypothetical protein GCL60_15915 [Silvanigrella paludirubra]